MTNAPLSSPQSPPAGPWSFFSSLSRRELLLALLAFFFGALLMLLTDFQTLDRPATAPVIVSEGKLAGALDRTPLQGAEGDKGAEFRQRIADFVPIDHDALEKQTPDLRRKAIVTMASNDETGMLALALFQSLHDGGTKVPRLILILARGGTGSIDCNEQEWKNKNGRRDVKCDGPNTIAGEIVSERFLQPMRAMGVDIVILDPFPETPYTRSIPGAGRRRELASIFWAKAMQKLEVFNMTSYPLDSTKEADQIDSLLWMDSDAFVVNNKNLDHLFNYPLFTGSLVTACAHKIGPAYYGGGIWHVKPSKALFADLMGFISRPVPGSYGESWSLGDMQVVRHYFSEGAPLPDSIEPLYPAINDLRCGYVPGLHKLGDFRAMSKKQFDDWIQKNLDSRKPRIEGCVPIPSSPRPSWSVFPIYLDQCVGTFAADPGRMEPLEQLYSVHFSCLQNVDKPSRYYMQGEKAMFEALKGVDRFQQFWFRKWYATYRKAMGGARFPPPLYDGQDGIEPWPSMKTAGT